MTGAGRPERPAGRRAVATVTLPALLASLLGAGLLTAGSVAVGVVGAGPAAADEVYAVPASGLPVTGHGYGHGHGMGQYGAQGAALQGVGYREILAHYYPGTAVGPLPAPSTVRVLVSEDSDDDLTVRADPGLALVDADGRRWTLPAGPNAWRVRADGASVQHVEALTGSWLPWTSPDGRSAFSQLRFEGPARVRVDLPGGGGRAYRGTVTAARAAGAALDTVNTVGFEQYLYGVVPRESPASWLPAALQAQAVAARTYSAYLRAASSGSWDLCSTTSCQVYGGSASYGASGALTELEVASTNAAVDATAGEVRLYGGRPAFTEFSSSTGGWNSDGRQPYLAPAPDPWDDWSGNPVHTWTATLTPAAIGAAYPTAGSVRGLRVTARDGRGEWGGRITSMVVEGVSSTGAPLSVAVSGNDFRARLGLRSEWWAVAVGAIQGKWLQLGGASSFLGAPVSSEYDVPGGRAQDFQGGRIYWSPATGAHEAHGAVLGRYLAGGGPGGPLGLPTSDELVMPGGAAQTFTGGHVYWSPVAGAQVVQGAVLGAYLALDGAVGRFGLPVAEEEPHAGGVRQRFQHGNVYWSAATGAHPVEGRVLEVYRTLGEGRGVLGLPLAGEVDVRGGRMALFAGGRMYWSARTDAHEVYGAVLGTYLAAGGSEGVLGLPTSGELRHADGRRQPFTGGQVYWSAATGAQPLWGTVLAEYRALRQAHGLLGWPVAAEAPVPGGVVARFAYGHVYWSPATGAHEVHGAILQRYLELGGPASLLGMPVRDERAVPSGARSDFTGGALLWRAATGEVVLLPR